MINIVAVPNQTEQRLVAVEFGIDSTLVGKSSGRPFQIEYDTSKLARGFHTVRAVGRDDDGNQIWSVSTRIVVRDSRTAPPGQEVAIKRDAGQRPTLLQPTSVPSSPMRSRMSDRRLDREVPRTRSQDRSSTKETARLRPLPQGIVLNQEYSNAFYGFSIKYPRGWTFEDRSTEMGPKSESDFWIQFGTYPVEKSVIVVNIRRIKLGIGVDEQEFQRRNTYVRNWERITVFGRHAFASTSRVLTPRPAVVHRLIIVGDGFVWMLNCTDYTGKSPDTSLGLFEQMVATLRIQSSEKVPANR
ncbi:MAG: hypothetical protein ACUVRS_00355 [Armatimonadota bacterium]